MAAPFKSQPAVRKAINNIYWQDQSANMDQADIDHALVTIADRFDVRLDDVQEYYSLLYIVHTAADKAVIFYNNGKWLHTEEPGIFDFRVDNQILPRGSVVIGCVFANGWAMVAPPFCDAGRKEHLKKILRQAREAVGLIDHEWVEGPHNAGSTTWVVQETD